MSDSGHFYSFYAMFCTTVKVKVYYTALFGIQKIKDKSTLVNGILDTVNIIIIIIIIIIIKKSVH